MFGIKKRNETKIDKCNYDMPQIGKEYYFVENEGTPFEGNRYYATVLDIKKGFVKYKAARKEAKTIFDNEVKTVERFIGIFNHKEN